MSPLPEFSEGCFITEAHAKKEARRAVRDGQQVELGQVANGAGADVGKQ